MPNSRKRKEERKNDVFRFDNIIQVGKMENNRKKSLVLLILFLIVYMGIAISLNVYYVKNNAYTAQYIEIAAVPGSGEVTFRGMLIDSSWYNPQDVIVDSSTWLKMKQERYIQLLMILRYI